MKNIIKDCPDAKIIVVTSMNKKELVVAAFKNGAKGYVLKPINTEKLIAEIDKVLDMS